MKSFEIFNILSFETDSEKIAEKRKKNRDNLFNFSLKYN